MRQLIVTARTGYSFRLVRGVASGVRHVNRPHDQGVGQWVCTAQFSPVEAAALYAQLFAPHKRTQSVLTAGTRIAALLRGNPLVLLDQAANRDL